MNDNRVYQYEGMFLFPGAQVSDLKAAVDHVNEIFARSGAEVLALSKWADRPLAYELKKQKRGVYMLAYFKSKGSQMVNIERDCRLSEMMLRFLITRADHLTEDEMRSADGRDALHTEIQLRATGGVPANEAAAAAAAPAPTPTPAPAAEATSMQG